MKFKSRLSSPQEMKSITRLLLVTVRQHRQGVQLLLVPHQKLDLGTFGAQQHSFPEKSNPELPYTVSKLIKGLLIVTVLFFKWIQIQDVKPSKQLKEEESFISLTWGVEYSRTSELVVSNVSKCVTVCGRVCCLNNNSDFGVSSQRVFWKLFLVTIKCVYLNCKSLGACPWA